MLEKIRYIEDSLYRRQTVNSIIVNNILIINIFVLFYLVIYLFSFNIFNFAILGFAQFCHFGFYLVLPSFGFCPVLPNFAILGFAQFYLLKVRAKLVLPFCQVKLFSIVCSFSSYMSLDVINVEKSNKM